jgi:hypothetical protein
MPSVKVVISNNIKLLNPPTPLRLKITGALVMKNPVYEDRLKRKLPTWGMESRIKMYSDDAGGNVLIPRGFFSEFDRLCKEAGYTVEYTDQRVKGTLAYFGWNDDIKLRDYQEKAMNDLKYNGVLVAPAGSGKTTIGMRYISEGKRAALWLVHTQELMDQAAKTAERAFPHVGRVGKIGSGICNYGDHKLIIAMVQTLHERPEIVEKLNEYIGTVVFDECHHFPATMFLELGSQLKAQWILGLTATPDRKDKLEKLMYVGLGPLQHEVARGSMYHDGTLIKPEINFIYTDFVSKQDIDEELENVDAGGEDLDYTGLIKELISDEARARLIAKTITTNVTKGPAIILSQSVRYSFKVAELVEQYLEEDGMRGVRICVIPIVAHPSVIRGQPLQVEQVQESIIVHVHEPTPYRCAKFVHRAAARDLGEAAIPVAMVQEISPVLPRRGR